MAKETHGMSKTSEYRIWAGMKTRCYNPSSPAYKYYGARGIKICKRWRDSFEAFYNDVGQRPSPNHSVDQIDNDGDYEPGNVRWATASQQASNTRRNRKFKHRGNLHTVSRLAKKNKVNRSLVYNRLNKGYPIQLALKTPSEMKRLKEKESVIASRRIRFKLKSLIEDKEFSERNSSSSKKITCKIIAQETGIPARIISQIANQKWTNVSISDLGKLCGYFDCQPGDLIKRT